MADLRQHSIEVILKNQSPSGAYIACPNMADYAYCWFRDGTFIAYAMGIVGEHNSARRFYAWGATVINARAGVVERALTKAARGEPLSATDYLHTRYTLDGQEGTDTNWPNFQLDGLGTWLWGLHKHLAFTRNTTLPADWARAADLVARYPTWPDYGGYPTMIVGKNSGSRSTPIPWLVYTPDYKPLRVMSTNQSTPKLPMKFVRLYWNTVSSMAIL